MNLISGKGETSSRLPAFSLFLPGSRPNNRYRRTLSLRVGLAASFSNATGGPDRLFLPNTTDVPVPAPVIGHGLLVLLAVGGVLFGGELLENLKKHHHFARSMTRPGASP